MSAKLVFAAILVAFLSTTSAARKDPLSQCNLLSNRKLAPFIYLSQSELAVIAHYSSVDYNAFKQGRVTNFHIVPACFIKGFHYAMDIEVWSGFQKCTITPLSNFFEYPSLFFLRRDHTTNRWLLINSGEYEHRVDTSGLLFGVDPSVRNFPEVCGLKRQRITVDQSKCESMACKGYCSFRLAPPNNCNKMRDMMLPFMNAADIPTDVAPFDSRTEPAFRNYPRENGSNGKDKTSRTTPGETAKGGGAKLPGQAVTYAPETGKTSKEVQATGGKNSAAVAAPTSGFFLFVALVTLCH